MKISIIGPTNANSLARRLGIESSKVLDSAKKIGEIIAQSGSELITMFHYEGMLTAIGDAYKTAGGKELTILYTQNDYDWETKPFLQFIGRGNRSIELPSWHDLLLTLVTKTDVVICVGLSTGVFTEMGYMKWNYREKKGAKALIGIEELLTNETLPIEITDDMGDFVKVVSIENLESLLKSYSSKKL